MADTQHADVLFAMEHEVWCDCTCTAPAAVFKDTTRNRYRPSSVNV